MLKKVVLAVGLIAIPSIAPAQQQQCRLECAWATEKGVPQADIRLSALA